MNLIEWIFDTIGLRPKTDREKFENRIKELEIKKAEAQLKFARERDKSNISKAEVYEKEIVQLQSAIDDEKKRFGVFDPDPLFNPAKLQENIRKAQECRANAQLKLETERSKLNPDFLKIDLYSREIKQWENLIEQLNERMAKGNI